jgi:hypothetical protein
MFLKSEAFIHSILKRLWSLYIRLKVLYLRLRFLLHHHRQLVPRLHLQYEAFVEALEKYKILLIIVESLIRALYGVLIVCSKALWKLLT